MNPILFLLMVQELQNINPAIADEVINDFIAWNEEAKQRTTDELKIMFWEGR